MFLFWWLGYHGMRLTVASQRDISLATQSQQKQKQGFPGLSASFCSRGRIRQIRTSSKAFKSSHSDLKNFCSKKKQNLETSRNCLLFRSPIRTQNRTHLDSSLSLVSAADEKCQRHGVQELRKHPNGHRNQQPLWPSPANIILAP